MKFAASLFAMALVTGAATALAQQQPVDIPPMKCDKPTLPGARMMEDRSIRMRFERDMKAHGDCVKAYVAQRQEAAKALQNAAKAHADAGNAAVNDYNAFVKETNEAARQ
ncbi:MAG TPA: hypothetical protein VFK48_11210 [Usitatibacter sp.]|nr:hypothetical protein [Usitatibacter sp.]